MQYCHSVASGTLGRRFRRHTSTGAVNAQICGKAGSEGTSCLVVGQTLSHTRGTYTVPPVVPGSTASYAIDGVLGFTI